MSDYPKGTVVSCANQSCEFLVMNAEGGWAHVDTHGKPTDHKAAPKPVTASTPPLVDVIAEAILRELSSPLWVAENEGMLDDPISAANSAARAVLDALTKAGGVEWGWEYQSIIGGDYDKRITLNWGGVRPLTREEAQASVDSMNKNTKHPDVARLVSRATGPWTEVEG